MSKGSPSPPAAPDPNVVSAAQTKSNKDTALYNFGLANPNVVSPLGSNTYSVSSTSPTFDQGAYNKALETWNAGGGAPLSKADWRAQNQNGNVTQSYDDYLKSNPGRGAMPTLDQFKTGESGNPQVTQNIALSPEQQQLYDLSTSQSIDLSKLASQLQGNVGATLSQPSPGSADFATSSKNAQDAYYKNQTQYLDQQWSQGQESLDAKLANQGITIGSQAYNNEQNNFARQKQSAYDTAQRNAINEGPQNAQQLFSLNSAARELPLNEFNALRSQSQVSMPQFQPTTPSMAAPTNTAANAYQSYAGQQNAYNQQVASQNATTGGLFSLAGSAAGAYGQYAGLSALAHAAGPAVLAASDVRLKENIKHIGYEKGFPIYTFSYISDPQKLTYRGVMAQDVLWKQPDAVEQIGEYLAVDYGKLGIEFARVH